VRGLADQGDAMCKEIFRVQAHALGLFFDEMVNTFDPDALIVGGGVLETSREFQWFWRNPREADNAWSRQTSPSTLCPMEILARAALRWKHWPCQQSGLHTSASHQILLMLRPRLAGCPFLAFFARRLDFGRDDF
jgi:predicted NBD/HSP70 family sugar kinase